MQTFTLTQLLELEKNVDIREPICPVTQLPLWSLVRIQVIRLILSRTLYDGGNSLINPTKPKSVAHEAKEFIISSIHNLTIKKEKSSEILIYNTGLGNFQTNGRIDDRLIGYFARTYGDNSVVYQQKLKQYFSQKFSLKSVRFSSPSELIPKLLARLTNDEHNTKNAEKFIQNLASVSHEKIGFKFEANDIAYLSGYLAKQLTRLPIFYKYYSSWFANSNFKLLILEDAAYGGHYVPLIAAAKLNNITVAEFQHGVISKGHDAYNISSELAFSEKYRTTLPDYLLTYGPWWSAQTNLPVKKLEIGNPHRSEVLKKYSSKPIVKNHVVILGDGVETDKYLDISRKVREVISDQTIEILFRPHPLEKDHINTKKLPRGILLDHEPDIYTTLKKSVLVISEISTGLFEAIGISDNVLIWDTPKTRFVFPEIPFLSFENDHELKEQLKLILSSRKTEGKIAHTDFWAEHWKYNFRDFVDSVLLNKNDKVIK